MSGCQHDFRGFDYSSLLKKWVNYCPKCGRISNEKTIVDERIKRIRKLREAQKVN